jgi:RHS repeat-associated protein
VYARARYLSPGTGQWLSEDPINLRTAQLPLGTTQWLSTGGVGLANALVLAAAMGRYSYAGNNPLLYSDPTGELLADTVRQGLSMTAAILGITAFAFMLPMLLIFKVAMAVELYDLAKVAADTLVGLAITVVVSAVAMVLLAPEMIAGLMGLYPAVALAAGYLLCLGIETTKWVNRGCKQPGAREFYGWAKCTLSLGTAIDLGNPWPLLRPDTSK